MKKKLFHEVTLQFFEDERTGQFGVAHADTYNTGDSSFNAGWNPVTLWHDLMEHWFEDKHPYFHGKYAMNVAGEMVASGATWYFYENLLSPRISHQALGNYFDTPDALVRKTTESFLIEAIDEGYCYYGDRLQTCIPKQKPVESVPLEYQIKELYKNVQKVKPQPHAPLIKEEKIFSKNYKKSCTFRAIADTHRYGYRMAARMFPRNSQNCEMAYDLWEALEKIVNKNSPQDLMREGATQLIVRFYKEKNKTTFRFFVKSCFKDEPIEILPGNFVEDLLIPEEEY